VQSAFADITDGLVSYWDFDDGSGTAAVDSIGGHNGTLQNFTGDPWTAGQVGGALSFDGQNDHVTTLTADDFSGARTIAGWIKRDDISRVEYFIDHSGHDFLVALSSTNQIIFCPNYNSGAGAGAILTVTNISWDTEWHHVAVTANDTTNELEVFFDGISKGTASPSWSAPTVNDYILGKKGDHNEYYFKGSMDEVAIWDRVISGDEVLEVFSYGDQGQPIGGGAVPEPATVVGIAIAALGFAARRMRKA
jgi:hypothetical protein